MKRHIFILIPLFIFYSYKGFAQNYKLIDSLKLIVHQSDSDTLKIKAYKDICWEYATTRIKLDTATMYADSIKGLANKMNYQYGKVLSQFYYGIINRFKGNYLEGLSHMEKFVEYNKLEGDSIKMASGLFQVAVMNSNLGNYDKSLEAYYRILNIHRANKNKDGIGFTLNSIGHIQRKLGKHKEAITSYEESRSLKIELNDNTGIWQSLLSLGNTYAELKEYKESEDYLIKAMSYAIKSDDQYGIAFINENLGNLYNQMDNQSKALIFHEKALELRKTLPSKKDKAASYHKVGKTFLNLGNTTKARTNITESLLLSEEMNATPQLVKIYQSMVELNEFENNTNDAFKYLKLYTKIKDSIFNSEKNKQLLAIETKYQTAQKDKEIELLTKENELKEKEAQRQDDIKKAMLIGLFLTLLLAVLIFYTLRQKLKNQKIIAAKNEELKVSNLKKELGTLEMKALRAQMNPHFLFNCMNSINTMILSDDNANASKYLTKFSKLVRLMLENSENPKVTLQDELEMLNAYVALESIRFKGKIKYTINVSKDIDREAVLIPSMVLQPFVENAIWHGLLHTTKKTGELSINVSEKNDFLYCSILDNGVGREASLKLQKKSKLKKKSMGIKITTDRLKLLTKEKIKEAVKVIDLKDDKNNAIGTQVDILIPIS